MSRTEKRVYISGTLDTPAPPSRKRGRAAVYKHFADDDTLYYKIDNQYHCITDDKPAKGYILKDHNGNETFMPLDFTDLLSYEEVRRLCGVRGVFIEKPGHHTHRYRTPPALLYTKTPTKKRPMWNRDAIDRHIEECLRRKKNAGLR